MSNYTIKLEGLELLYHLLEVKKMSYKSAVELMIKHNQDMTFLNEISAEYQAENMLIDENNKLNEEG